MIRRIIIHFTILVVAGLSMLFGYFWYYEHFALSLIHDKHMYHEKANALKHVYAAADMTTWLMRIVPAERAENAVIWLGNTNEYMEQLIRFPKDTVAESIKDLSNNQVGITIGLWNAQHPEKGSLRDLVLAIGDQSVVVEKADDVRVNSADALLTMWPAVDAARRYFEKNKYDIMIKTKHALVRLPPPRD